MTPTAEMIEAARSAIRYLNSHDTPWSDEQVSAVVTAALAAMPAQGVRVKPLEWEDKPGLSFAKTSIGTYFIRERHGYWKLELDDAVITASDTAIVFPSLRAAKAAAQADYEARIMAALEPAPAGGDVAAIPKMRPIPIAAAKRIAKEYGYDQVLIYARRCHDTPEPHGEHMTTYGRNAQHCDVAALIGDTLKKFMGWEV